MPNTRMSTKKVETAWILLQKKCNKSKCSSPQFVKSNFISIFPVCYICRNVQNGNPELSTTSSRSLGHLHTKKLSKQGTCFCQCFCTLHSPILFVFQWEIKSEEDEINVPIARRAFRDKDIKSGFPGVAYQAYQFKLVVKLTIESPQANYH